MMHPCQFKFLLNQRIQFTSGPNPHKQTILRQLPRTLGAKMQKKTPETPQTSSRNEERLAIFFNKENWG